MEFANSDRQQRRKLMMRSQPEQALECPRCASTNTKFCYYNNYSLSQPRYFCKGCRRYWTQGGSLRNVPVGGGCRKTKRPPSSSSSSTATTSSSSSFSTVSSSSKRAQDYHHHHHHHHQDLTITHSNPLLSPTLIPSLLPYDSSDDLTFPAFSRLQMQSLPMEEDNSNNSSIPSLHLSNTVQASAAPSNGFLDILSTGSGGHLYYGMATTGVSAGGGGGLLSLEGAAGLLAGSGAAGSTAATGHGSSCKAMDGVLDNKVVSGLPWQDASMDSAKESWNGGVLGSSSLQGLINSSLLRRIDIDHKVMRSFKVKETGSCWGKGRTAAIV